MRSQLVDVDRNAFVGMEGSAAWNTAVRRGTPRLFAVSGGANGGTASVHSLSLRETRFAVGALHGQTKRAIWAGLQLELLYFANDDDERYSIQSHPHILRNLCIAAADEGASKRASQGCAARTHGVVPRPSPLHLTPKPPKTTSQAVGLRTRAARVV